MWSWNITLAIDIFYNMTDFTSLASYTAVIPNVIQVDP